uniref:Uncharacterized protein n=1 Tax=Parasteatoda tepidariorum TaxID=114398 RepID=A0A2L2YL11_PARTP
MIDIFLQKDVKKLLKNKNIVFMGDSNIRALYKDILCLLDKNRLISQSILKKKGETSCFGDRLVSGTLKYNGREYKEERKRYHENTTLSFYFLTRVYNKYVKKILNDLSKDPQNMPDVVLLNSCLWDVTRWGPHGVELDRKS